VGPGPGGARIFSPSRHFSHPPCRRGSTDQPAPRSPTPMMRPGPSHSFHVSTPPQHSMPARLPACNHPTPRSSIPYTTMAGTRCHSSAAPTPRRISSDEDASSAFDPSPNSQCTPVGCENGNMRNSDGVLLFGGDGQRRRSMHIRSIRAPWQQRAKRTPPKRSPAQGSPSTPLSHLSFLNPKP
jgi:hypothetical protein